MTIRAFELASGEIGFDVRLIHSLSAFRLRISFKDVTIQAKDGCARQPVNCALVR